MAKTKYVWQLHAFAYLMEEELQRGGAQLHGWEDSIGSRYRQTSPRTVSRQLTWVPIIRSKSQLH